jgi:hypothetical protein
MATILYAHFDGRQSLVLDEPVNLPVGTPLRIMVETVENNSEQTAGPSTPPTANVTAAPRCFQPLDIQIDPELSHAIA